MNHPSPNTPPLTVAGARAFVRAAAHDLPAWPATTDRAAFDHVRATRPDLADLLADIEPLFYPALGEKRATELDTARNRVRAFLDAYEREGVGDAIARAFSHAEEWSPRDLTVSDLRTLLAGE